MGIILLVVYNLNINVFLPNDTFALLKLKKSILKITLTFMLIIKMIFLKYVRLPILFSTEKLGIIIPKVFNTKPLILQL